MCIGYFVFVYRMLQTLHLKNEIIYYLCTKLRVLIHVLVSFVFLNKRLTSVLFTSCGMGYKAGVLRGCPRIL